MFDDIKDTPAQTPPPVVGQGDGGVPKQSDVPAQIPPTGAPPEQPTQPAAPVQPPTPAVVEDVLAVADSEAPLPAGPDQPAAPTPIQSQVGRAASQLPGDQETPGQMPAAPAQPAMQQPPAAPAPFVPENTAPWADSPPEAHSKKRILLIGIGVVVVLLLGIGGYIAYSSFFAEDATVAITPEVSEEQNVPADVDDDPVAQDTNGLPEVEEEDAPEEAVELTLSRDSDGDGLTDEDERQYNTDPLLPDSDRDGLFDREEVITWNTDPLNPDSDGDSYPDGDEVKNGYDPLGEGTLDFYEYITF